MEGSAEKFDWVTARLECSPEATFKRLHAGAKSDVVTMNGIAARTDRQDTFSISSIADRRFVVSREKFGASWKVEFSFDQTRITADNGSQTFRAEPKLSDAGTCRLAMDGRELELWQFRKAALEDLFFKEAN